MKTTKPALLVLSLLAGLTASADKSHPKAQTLKAFTTADHPISKAAVVTAGETWLLDCKKAQTIRLWPRVMSPAVKTPGTVVIRFPSDFTLPCGVSSTPS